MESRPLHQSSDNGGTHVGTVEVGDALLTQFKQLSSIFDSLNVIVYVADLETFELLFMNAYAAKLFGEDFPGRRCYEMLQTGQTSQCPFCTNDRLVRDGEPLPPYAWEFQNTVTGQWFLCIDQAIRWNDGRLVRMEVAVDITDRKQVESEREQLLAQIQRQAAELDATITSMADGVVICAGNGEILQMNSVAEHLLSYTSSEAALPPRERLALLRLQAPGGKPLPPDQAPLIRALEYGETTQGVVAGRSLPDGSVRWMSMSASPIFDAEGRQHGAVGTLTDITALHELEEQREDYLHMVSHDLRNPLTPIIGTAGWLQRRLREQGMDLEAESAELISESAWRIQGMTEDLIEAARLEGGRLQVEREPAVICQLIDNITSRFGLADQRERIQISCPDSLPVVEIDRERLERVLVNLLNNALKYSPPKTPIVLRADADEDQVRLIVENEGEGIPAEELPHVFERYYRARTGRKTEGLGLGLYIARKIVEAHDGQIWAESVPGKTTFAFTLPVADAIALPG